MKFAFGTLAAVVVLSACSSATSRYVMRVDRSFDRSAQPLTPSGDLSEASYRAEAPADRWEIAIDGSKVVLTAIGEHPTRLQRLEGHEVSGTAGKVRRFDLEGAPAGGRFVLRDDEAELTVFGSGVPVVSSERGKVVPR
jgi:hypothetical protein